MNFAIKSEKKKKNEWPKKEGVRGHWIQAQGFEKKKKKKKEQTPNRLCSIMRGSNADL